MAAEAILLLAGDFPLAQPEAIKEKYYSRWLKELTALLYSRSEYFFLLFIEREGAQWLKSNHNELLTIWQELAAHKRLELLGGLFDNSLLGLISNTDRLGQIEDSAIWARDISKHKPRGFFLPYGLWEPSFPAILAPHSFNYSFVAAELFINAKAKNLFKAYLVEETAKTVAVFPYFTLEASKDYRQLAADYAQLAEKQGGNLLTFLFKDFNTKWLAGFLEELKSYGIALTQPAKYLKRQMVLQRLYLPASGAETLGGNHNFYRNYLFEQVETGLLYARALAVTAAVRLAKDKGQKKLALKSLWQSQNHQLYWASRYGGIRNPVLRDYAYRNLLQADSLAGGDKLNYGLIEVDFDLDGAGEVLYRGAIYNAFTQHTGGLLFELDYLPAGKNLLNIFNDGPLQRAFHDVFVPIKSDWAVMAEELKEDNFYQCKTQPDADSVNYLTEKILDKKKISIKKEYIYYKNTFEVNYYFKGEILTNYYFAAVITFH